MKAAFASIVCLAVMLLLILLGAEDPGGLFWIAVLSAAALSIAFALIAVGGAMTSKQPDDGWRPMSVLIALVVLGGFGLAISAILIAFGDSFE